MEEHRGLIIVFLLKTFFMLDFGAENFCPCKMRAKFHVSKGGKRKRANGRTGNRERGKGEGGGGRDREKGETRKRESGIKRKGKMREEEKRKKGENYQ